jgi:hypothetical protein
MPEAFNSATALKVWKEDENKLGNLWGSNCERIPPYTNSVEIRLAEDVNTVRKQTLHGSK